MISMIYFIICEIIYHKVFCISALTRVYYKWVELFLYHGALCEREDRAICNIFKGFALYI